MMAKGTYAMILIRDGGPRRHLRALQASGVEVVQEPMDQPYGVRDFAVRDPAGNLVRIKQLEPQGGGRSETGRTTKARAEWGAAPARRRTT